VSRIPLYDATAPIACTIESDEIPERLALLERLRTNLVRLDVTEHGLLLHFPHRPDIFDDLQRFAVDEKRCCQFWGFAVDDTEGELILRWDAPPDARDLLARIAVVLQNDEPLTTIAGLL
jgi:hypothetical protein